VYTCSDQYSIHKPSQLSFLESVVPKAFGLGGG
jgi:hypothetical protein